MADNVGSMEVEYSVAVEGAIASLKKLNTAMANNEKKFTKQSKTQQMGNKKVGIAQKLMTASVIVGTAAVTAGVAVAVAGLATMVGGLYGIIKASSYGSMYMAQMSAILQQVADTIMEKTGLNTALEDGIRAFQNFADVMGEQGFLVALLGLIEEFKVWSWEKWLAIKADPEKIWGPIRQLWNIVITLATKAWNFIKTEIYPKLASWWTNVLVPKVIGAFQWIWAFVKTLLPQWVIDIIDWAVGMGEAIYKQDWQGVWDKVVEPLEWAWNKFKETKLGGMINDFLEKVKEYAPQIKKCIETLVEWADVGAKIGQGIIDGILAKLRSFTSPISPGRSSIGSKGRFAYGGGVGGSLGTTIKPSSMPGGGDYGNSRSVNDAIISPGGKVITTHPMDYLIATKTPEKLMSGSGGGDTYNIAPVINVTSSGSNGDLSRQVSKAIADEIKRIVKV